MTRSEELGPSPAWDIVTSLLYPAVLGTLMYTLVLLGQEWLDGAAAEKWAFYSLGAPRWLSIVIVALITGAICWHFSADFLYSKYCVSTYRLTHFVVDLVVCASLAGSYAAFAAHASGDFASVIEAMTWLWVGMLVVYLSFMVWDFSDYRRSVTRGTVPSQFFLGMLKNEFLSVAAILFLLGASAWIEREGYPGWAIWTHVSVSIALLFILAWWLWRETMELRANEVPPALSPAGVVSAGATLVPADANDLDAAAELMSATYRTVYEEPWSISAARARLSDVLEADPAFCFVLKDEKGMAGLLFARRHPWYDGDALWIEEIVVREDLRGQGIGTEVLQQVERIAAERLVKSIGLHARKGSGAERLYRNLGYEQSEWMHEVKALAN